jgi:hypothetical protein
MTGDLFGGGGGGGEGGGGGGKAASSSASSASAINFAGGGAFITEDGGLGPLGVGLVLALGLAAFMGILVIARK